jgi:hypothetical protein
MNWNSISFKLVFVVFLLMFTVVGCEMSGALSQEEATQMVIAELFLDSELDDPVIMFEYSDALKSEDVLSSYRLSSSDSPVFTKQISEKTWFFWIDDAPAALFAHPTRFVFVQASSGEVTVVDEDWWPVLNGESLWVDEDEYWDEDNWAFSNINISKNEGILNRELGSKVIKSLAASVEVNRSNDDSKKPGTAIIINGWEPGQTGKNDFTEDVKGMYTSLKLDAGFDTWYYGPEVSGVRKPSGESTLSDLGSWFLKMSEDMKSGETLFVFITSHGQVNEDGKGYLGDISEEMMEIWLDGFDEGVNIVFVGHGCYSGSFLDSLADVADVAVASTGDKDPSFFDVDLEFMIHGWEKDPNPEDKGSEFVSGLTLAFDQILLDPEAKKAVEEEAAKAGDNFWNRLIGKAFVTALENDVAYLSGKTFPSIVRKPIIKSGVIETTDHGYVWADELGDGIICQTGSPLTVDTPSEIDIGSVAVEWLDADNLGLIIEFPGIEILDQPVIGSFEFDDLSIPNSNPSETWYFSGKGEVDGNFYFRPPEPIYTEAYTYYDGSGWVQDPDQSITAEIHENQIHLIVPVEDFSYLEPPTEEDLRIWVGVTTPEFLYCDSAFLDEDGQAQGLIPESPGE